jgi:hypothetical protein
MEIKCLECGLLVPQTPGKRKKEYCGPTCRTKCWKKKKDAGKDKKRPGRPPKYPVIQNKPVVPLVKENIIVEPKTHPEAPKSPKREQEMPSGLSKTDMLKWHKAQNYNR